MNRRWRLRFGVEQKEEATLRRRAPEQTLVTCSSSIAGSSMAPPFPATIQRGLSDALAWGGSG